MNDQTERLTQNNDTFVERLAHQLGITANAKYIYAEPIRSDGITIVPVAKASYGLGGGSGKKAEEEGSGGGGGVSITPVGYIEIKDGETHFRSTRDLISLLPVILTAAPLILLSVWRIGKLFKRK